MEFRRRVKPRCKSGSMFSAIQHPKIQRNGNAGAVSMNQPADGDYSVVRARWSSDATHFVRQAKPFKGSLRDLAKAYAPRVHMHPPEEWFPSSVSFLAKYVVRKPDRYTTQMPLDSPSSSDFPGAVGQRPDKASVPVYAVVADNEIEAGKEFTDIVYFMLYPYNRGKRKIDTMWGNHVGDWEHFTVRFNRSDTDYVPVKVSFSVHDTNIELPWGAPDFLTVDTHVVAFEAKGTHAVFPAQGHFVYKNIAVLGSLIDDTGTGVAWDTWNNVVLVTKEASGKYACIGHDGTRNAEDCKRWLNYPAEFRWGNAEEGRIAGHCRLEQGPTGPTTKAAVTDVNRFD